MYKEFEVQDGGPKWSAVFLERIKRSQGPDHCKLHDFKGKRAERDN